MFVVPPSIVATVSWIRFQSSYANVQYSIVFHSYVSMGGDGGGGHETESRCTVLRIRLLR